MEDAGCSGKKMKSHLNKIMREDGLRVKVRWNSLSRDSLCLITQTNIHSCQPFKTLLSSVFLSLSIQRKASFRGRIYVLRRGMDQSNKSVSSEQVKGSASWERGGGGGG